MNRHKVPQGFMDKWKVSQRRGMPSSRLYQPSSRSYLSIEASFSHFESPNQTLNETRVSNWECSQVSREEIAFQSFNASQVGLRRNHSTKPKVLFMDDQDVNLSVSAQGRDSNASILQTTSFVSVLENKSESIMKQAESFDQPRVSQQQGRDPRKKIKRGNTDKELMARHFGWKTSFGPEDFGRKRKLHEDTRKKTQFQPKKNRLSCESFKNPLDVAREQSSVRSVQNDNTQKARSTPKLYKNDREETMTDQSRNKTAKMSTVTIDDHNRNGSYIEYPQDLLEVEVSQVFSPTSRTLPETQMPGLKTSGHYFESNRVPKKRPYLFEENINDSGVSNQHGSLILRKIGNQTPGKRPIYCPREPVVNSVTVHGKGGYDPNVSHSIYEEAPRPLLSNSSKCEAPKPPKSILKNGKREANMTRQELIWLEKEARIKELKKARSESIFDPYGQLKLAMLIQFEDADRAVQCLKEEYIRYCKDQEEFEEDESQHTKKVNTTVNWGPSEVRYFERDESNEPSRTIRKKHIGFSPRTVLSKVMKVPSGLELRSPSRTKTESNQLVKTIVDNWKKKVEENVKAKNSQYDYLNNAFAILRGTSPDHRQISPKKRFALFVDHFGQIKESGDALRRQKELEIEAEKERYRIRSEKLEKTRAGWFSDDKFVKFPFGK